MQAIKSVKLMVVILALFLMAVGNVLADPFDRTLPEIEGLPGMQLQWIGKKMAINGLPMSMRAFNSSSSADQILDAYQGRWKTRGSAQTTRSEFDGAQSVGMEYRGHYYSVQAYDVSGGSQGVLTVGLAPAKASPDFSTRFPLPLGSNVEQKIEAIDNGKRMETLIVTSQQSVGSLAAYVNASMRRQGWAEQNFGNTQPGHKERVLNFQRGAELSQIVVIDNPPAYPGKTLMTVHWVKN
ncbi:MAG: hypothetical protein COB94_007780 [Gammaproteobacteria bacterium]|nr:hypothetical protein [Gammaproteobacteria bacterium]PHS70174.1 MAG: hypothetical protein COB00_05035 [Alcanivorax sp.]